MNILRNASWIAIMASLYFIPGAASAEPVSLDTFDHIHGFAIDPGDSSRLLLATHYGMFSATSDGLAVKMSDLTADFMSFAVSPDNPEKMYASGHSQGGGNLGVMMSEDTGVTWRQISKGGADPVDFHTLTVSPADSRIIYGLYNGLHKSRDGGLSWERVGDAPPDTFSLAASTIDPKTLYAATREGLQRSDDSGHTWQPAYVLRRPVTSIHITPTGEVYAFVYGIGLIAAQEPELVWRTIGTGFQDRYLIAITRAPDNSDQLFGIVDTGTVMVGKDAGASWYSYEGSNQNSDATVRSGQQLYVNNCQACHGESGKGERPGDPYAQDEFGFVAPPLNDDAHGWHHSDRQLVDTILDGSPRNERMIAWKESLSREDAEKIVIYIKSLWSFRSLACQGVRHMACMQ